MVLRVRSDRMSLSVDPLNKGRSFVRHGADQEESRLHAFSGESVQNTRRVRGRWPIVEGENNLMIMKRQGFLVFHVANTAIFLRADKNDPACAKRVQMAMTLFRFGSRHP